MRDAFGAHRNFGRGRCGAHRFWKSGATVQGVIFNSATSETRPKAAVRMEFELFDRLAHHMDIYAEKADWDDDGEEDQQDGDANGEEQDGDANGEEQDGDVSDQG